MYELTIDVTRVYIV